MSGEESLEDLKYLLGNMGVEILIAIDKGAKDFETIKLISSRRQGYHPRLQAARRQQWTLRRDAVAEGQRLAPGAHVADA